MVISSNSSVERSNKVIAPGWYASSKGGIARSFGPMEENLGVVAATFSAPGPGPQEASSLLVQSQLEGQVK